jgi:hypothetical protein
VSSSGKTGDFLYYNYVKMCEKAAKNSEITNENMNILKTTVIQDIKENIDLNLPPTKEDEDEENYIL